MARFFLIANYIVEAKEMWFKIKLQNFKKTMTFVEAEIPAPMSSQFTDRIGKTKASEKKASRLSIANAFIHLEKLKISRI